MISPIAKQSVENKIREACNIEISIHDCKNCDGTGFFSENEVCNECDGAGEYSTGECISLEHVLIAIGKLVLLKNIYFFNIKIDNPNIAHMYFYKWVDCEEPTERCELVAQTSYGLTKTFDSQGEELYQFLDDIL